MQPMLGFSDEVLAIAMPLAAATLSVVVFYLRSLREHQIQQHAELVRRLERIEEESERLRRTLRETERMFASKEEWLRETMFARRRLEVLTRAVAAMQGARADGSCSLDARR